MERSKLPALIALLWASGCATGVNEDMIWLKTMPAFDKYPKIRRVAIIPFSEYYVTGGEKSVWGVPYKITEDNSKIVGDIFTEELKQRVNYKVISPDTVAAFFKKRKEKPFGMLPPKELQRVGKLLKVDAVITGQVDDCASYKYRMFDNSRVAFQVRMTDPVTGETVWKGSIALDQEGRPDEVARRGIRLLLDQLGSRSDIVRTKRETPDRILNR
jgi:hypothetical protein